jgi:hypothetical protein
MSSQSLEKFLSGAVSSFENKWAAPAWIALDIMQREHQPEAENYQQ